MEATTLRRKTRRFPIKGSVQYFTLEGAGVGTVRDVSLEGAEIRGDFVPTVGSLVALVVYLPDGNAPAMINRAAVQWTKEHCFAVKFPPMPAGWKHRLLRCCGIPAGHEHLLFTDTMAVAAGARKP